jgi:hypothetical protein
MGCRGTGGASTVVEIDANHLTITTHPDAAAAVRRFLADVHGR